MSVAQPARTTSRTQTVVRTGVVGTVTGRCIAMRGYDRRQKALLDRETRRAAAVCV
jgi:hypothetical protein